MFNLIFKLRLYLENAKCFCSILGATIDFAPTYALGCWLRELLENRPVFDFVYLYTADQHLSLVKFFLLKSWDKLRRSFQLISFSENLFINIRDDNYFWLHFAKLKVKDSKQFWLDLNLWKSLSDNLQKTT